MTTAFPTALDTPTNPIATDAMNAVTVPHATQHANVNDAVVALETKVGIDGSAVTTTHDYKLAHINAANIDNGTLPLARLSGITTSQLAASAGVTLAQLATMAAATILGNNTIGASVPIALTAAQVKTLLAIAASDVSGLATVATTGSAADLSTGTLPAGRMPALTGDITTSAGAVATAIGAHKVTRGMQAQGGARSLIGVIGDATADVADMNLCFLAVASPISDISITGTASPTTWGQEHRCTGTSADYTVTLPACSTNQGKMIGFVMDRALTKLVTLARSGSDVIGESLTSIVLWAGESIVLRVNAAADGYEIVSWRQRAMRARFTDPGALSISASTDTTPAFAAIDFDIGGLASTSLHYFTVRRAGYYRASLSCRWASGQTATRLAAAINWYPSNHVGGTRFADSEVATASTVTVPGNSCSGMVQLAAAQIFDADLFHNSASARNTVGINFTIEECLP